MDLPVKYDDIPYDQKWKVRKAYIELQEGKCYHCGQPLDGPPSQVVIEQARDEVDWSLFPSGFLDNPHHLHHSHVTGMTLGVCHGKCNGVLWAIHGE